MAAPDPMAARRAEADLEKRRADALLTACDLGLVDDVSDLITSGASTDVTDKRGSRPMFFAAARGHTAVVELLCSHGVDPNDDDALGRTPLHFAAMHDHPETVRALCARDGIWVDAPDHADDTPSSSPRAWPAPRPSPPSSTPARIQTSRTSSDSPSVRGGGRAGTFRRGGTHRPRATRRPEVATRRRRRRRRARDHPSRRRRDDGPRRRRGVARARGAKVTRGASHATRAGSNPPSFAELDPETRARAALRACASETERAGRRGRSDASRDALDAHAQLTQEVELRAFLMRLVDDDEFQEDMRDATVRRGGRGGCRFSRRRAVARERQGDARPGRVSTRAALL